MRRRSFLQALLVAPVAALAFDPDREPAPLPPEDEVIEPSSFACDPRMTEQWTQQLVNEMQSNKLNNLREQYHQSQAKAFNKMYERAVFEALST